MYILKTREKLESTAADLALATPTPKVSTVNFVDSVDFTTFGVASVAARFF